MDGSKFKLRPSALSAQVEKQQQQSKEILQQRQKTSSKGSSEPVASSALSPTVISPTANVEPNTTTVPPSNSFTNSSSTEVTTPDPAANSLFTPSAITSTSATTATNGNNETQLTTNANESDGSVSNLVVQNNNQETNGKTGNSLTANASSNSNDEATPIPGFVFGQNLAERVILSPPKDTSTDNNEPISKVEQLKQQLESPAPPILTKSEDTIGSKVDSGEKLSPVAIKPAFSSSCNSTGNTIASPSNSNNTSTAGSSSSTSAKRKYEAITGEENESNVLQIHCRLYHWEGDEGPSSISWKEKGRGFLKLNDRKSTETSDKFTSRLVMRTAGSLKLILNASLVSGMTFTKSSETTLRFTNHDGIYSIKGKEKDIELLYSSVEYRMRELAKKVKSDDGVTKSCEISGDEKSDPSPSNLFLGDDEVGDEDTRDDENESSGGQKGDEDESTTSTVAREIDDGTSDSQTPVMSSSESSSQT